jgi:UDP-N-acetylmuramate--alanine ligase
MNENRITQIFGSIKHIHMIGIGGIGMSGIADVLLRIGFLVSGSDSTDSSITEHLRSLGAKIYIGHHRDHIQKPDVVVYSSAIKQDNPEYRQAQRAGIKLIRRAEFLGMLLSVWPIRIGVAGTHGKTTTSSVIAAALDACGSHPSVFIGGIIKDYKTNARLDSKTCVIFEADEYDRTFLALPPTLAVITNVDADHLDIYRDIDDMKSAFTEYANSIPENGSVILCIDSPETRELLLSIDRPCVTYGTDPDADFRVDHIRYDQRSHFTLYFINESIGDFHIPQVGKHYVLNATAAIVCAYLLHLDIPSAGKGIASFSGVERRLELRHESEGLLFYDDYAHHPTEIRATLEGLRIRYPEKRLIIVFQPHLYSRTRDFATGFAQSLQLADKVYLTDIYPAREAPIKGINSALIAEMMLENGYRDVHYIPDMTDIPATLAPLLRNGDVVLTLGAGDIWKINDPTFEAWNERQ